MAVHGFAPHRHLPLLTSLSGTFWQHSMSVSIYQDRMMTSWRLYRAKTEPQAEAGKGIMKNEVNWPKYINLIYSAAWIPKVGLRRWPQTQRRDLPIHKE
ncbi:hypothetical protein EF849_15885 [Aeromonas jandaei]|nr:hypothetical protein [Aeromonas jandaei]